MSSFTNGLNSIRKRFTLGKKGSEQALEGKSMLNMVASDFETKRLLGTGSFGKVFLVQHKGTKKYYATKVLEKDQVVKLKQVEHTLNERNILMMIDNPFIVNMIASFQDDRNLYVVMEYVPGGELFTYLRRAQRFEPEQARFFSAEILCAFEYLHSKDILYRDLKPENLLLDAEGHIRITDFGFGKVVTDITWTLCGTPDYLAPEMIQSKGYGKAVDWYAFGVLLYEMLAGYPPYFDDDPVKLYEKILGGKLRFPPRFDPDAKDLCKKLLTHDLTRRYGNLKNGVKDIKFHKWFTGIDWKRAAKRQLPPVIIPRLTGEGDASNFDSYEDEPLQSGPTTGTDGFGDLFKDF